MEPLFFISFTKKKQRITVLTCFSWIIFAWTCPPSTTCFIQNEYSLLFQWNMHYSRFHSWICASVFASGSILVTLFNSIDENVCIRMSRKRFIFVHFELILLRLDLTFLDLWAYSADNFECLCSRWAILTAGKLQSPWYQLIWFCVDCRCSQRAFI